MIFSDTRDSVASHTTHKHSSAASTDHDSVALGLAAA